MPQKKLIEVPLAQLAHRPDPAPNAINYSDIETRPSLLKDPAGWWASKTDDEKQAVLDSLGEFAGGTVGAIAGAETGPGAMISAGAGAVAGRNLARVGGKVAGLKPTPKSATAELKDQAITFGSNALGEGVGRVAGSVVKAGASKLAKAVIRPDAEKVALAAERGIDMTPGMLSQGEVPKMVERHILGKFPGSSEGIRAATKKAVDQAQGAMSDRIASLGPKLNDQATGQALQSARAANVAAGSRQFGEIYGQLAKRMSGIEADPLPYNQAARDVMDSIARDKVSLPSSTRDLLHRASRAGVKPEAQVTMEMSPEAKNYLELADATIKKMGGDAPYSASPEWLQKIADKALSEGGLAKPDLTTVARSVESKEAPLTAGELVNLRTQLNELSRKIQNSSPSLDKRAIPALLKGLDDSIDNTLTNAGESELLNKWRETNAQYRKFKQTYFKSPNPERPEMGNATAGRIQRATKPEDAIVAGTKSEVQQSEKAVTPKALRRINSEFEPPPLDSPMPALRRNRAEQLLQDSAVENKYLGDDRYVRPQRFERLLGESAGTQELLRPIERGLEGDVRAAKAVASPMRLENTSMTAPAGMYMKMGAAGGAALAGAATGNNPEEKLERAAEAGAGMYLLPKLASKAWTSPALRNALTTATPSISMNRGASGTFYGALGRLASPSTDSSLPPELDSPNEQPQQKKKLVEVPLSDLQ